MKTGLESVIPRDVIANARGLAILTVVKAGLVWSGRAGTGLVIAKLPDNTWSAPSGIGTAGVGFGWQIGAEMTEFVMVLNTDEAVAAFSMGGNVTLGGSLSLAAGPIGRTGEVSGMVGSSGSGSGKNKIASVFSYSKSKGLFAGVSLEGSVIVERKDANERLYRRRVGAKDILSGQVNRPEAAQELYQALMKVVSTPHAEDDVPSYSEIFSSTTTPVSDSSTNKTSSAPSIPQRPHPSSANPGSQQQMATALFDYKAQQPEDLSFKKGDSIAIIRKSNSQNDWWLGKNISTGAQGNFPANYVKLN